MMYSMFIDDERFPPEDGNEWVICRTMDDVKCTIMSKGFPQFVSFDHDLGENEPSGMDIAHWMVEHDLDERVIPEGFGFYVHSQNPVGAANINCLLNNYLRTIA